MVAHGLCFDLRIFPVYSMSRLDGILQTPTERDIYNLKSDERRPVFTENAIDPT